MADQDESDDEPSIVIPSFRAGAGGLAMTDAVHPTAIRHEVAEINADGAPFQRYNYLKYEFAKDGAFCRARSYVDTTR